MQTKINQVAAQEIFKDFISGKVINADEFVNGTFKASAKFRELVDNLEEYRQLYQFSGFDICSVGDRGFYISRRDREDSLNEVGANIQTLILVISRGLTLQGVSPAILFDIRGGISDRELDVIGEIDEIAIILRACDITTPLMKSVSSILLERGIFEKTEPGRYVLSSSGRILFKALFDEKGEAVEDVHVD